MRQVREILTAPTATVTDPVERGTARLLSVCLLGLVLAFATLDITLLLARPGYSPPWYGYVVLSVCYALSRSKYHRWAAVLTPAMFPTVALGIALHSSDGLQALSFAILAPFFAGLFLGVRGAIGFGILAPSIVAVVPLLSDRSFDNVVNHFAANVVGGFVAVSYAMHRDWVEKRRRKANQLHEAQLVQMQKMEALGRMAGGIAHDFNNLLTVISGGIELLHRRGVGKELRLIESATQSAQTLTSQLLTLSRQRVVESGSSDLARALEGTQRLLSRIIGEDIRVKVSVARGTHPVAISETQLEQVLLNLATNARDAMPEGGTLEFVAANKGPSTVELVVRDTGSGMDWETREKLFEPFFTTKAVGKGTGLGLSMVFGIVSQIGGSINVESEPGEGATFILTLPRAQQIAAPPPSVQHRLDLDGRARGRVLLVEDDAGVRELCRSVLGREGYFVIEASDPEEALAIFEQRLEKIDLLISDIVMPKSSGIALAETLRKHAPDLPVLYISGYAPDHLQGKPVDSRLILQKPFRPTELLKRVSTVLYGLDSVPPSARANLPSEAKRIPPLDKVPSDAPVFSEFRFKEATEGEPAPPEESTLRDATRSFSSEDEVRETKS